MKVVDRAAVLLRRSLTLGTLLDRLAHAFGSRRLVEEAGSGLALSYEQGARRVAELSSRIADRVDRGDRVVVAVPNSYEFFLLCLAVSRAGAVFVPLNPRMSGSEVDHVIADARAELVVRAVAELDTSSTPTGRLPSVPAPSALRPTRPGDVAGIFYTSGTTGKPKGAELTHSALLAAPSLASAYPSGLRREELVCGMPVAHIAGFAVLLACACAGVPLYLLRRFDAREALEAIESRRATMFVGVPAMYRMMLESGAAQRDLRSVRLWGSGADAMPRGLLLAFKRMGASATLPLVGRSVGEAAFVDGYGMVELAGAVALRVSPPGADPDLPLIPLPPYRMRAVDDEGCQVGLGAVGELVVKGPGVLKGYHQDPGATGEVLDQQGWLRTGDLARRLPLGLISLAGRRKDVIKHGGFSVFAVEVEHALEEHPLVAEAAVVGLPDERMGEVPVAAVRLRPGAELTPEDLLSWARTRMAGYKVPRRAVMVDQLPRTGTDKVQKAPLVALFEASPTHERPGPSAGQGTDSAT